MLGPFKYLWPHSYMYDIYNSISCDLAWHEWERVKDPLLFLIHVMWTFFNQDKWTVKHKFWIHLCCTAVYFKSYDNGQTLFMRSTLFDWHRLALSTFDNIFIVHFFLSLAKLRIVSTWNMMYSVQQWFAWPLIKIIHLIMSSLLCQCITYQLVYMWQHYFVLFMHYTIDDSHFLLLTLYSMPIT